MRIIIYLKVYGSQTLNSKNKNSEPEKFLSSPRFFTPHNFSWRIAHEKLVKNNFNSKNNSKNPKNIQKNNKKTNEIINKKSNFFPDLFKKK